MKRLKIIGVGISFLLMFLFSCTNTNNGLTGNGTQIGNPTIIGVVYQPGGKIPAQNAAVYLRNKNSLINIGKVGLNKKTADIAVVSTNAKGEFAIDSVGPGTYVIECSDRFDNYALYDSVVVASSDSSITLPIDTLRPAGVIKGNVNLSEGGDFSKVYVLVYGVQRFSLVDTNGNFYLDNLAEGDYKLRIISNLDNYDNLDTSMIPVVSGDTTRLDTVKLPFTGVPIVKNLTFSYDTVARKVTLSWDKIDSSHILGFNIYRSEKYMTNAALIMGSQKSDAKISVDPIYTKLNNNMPINESVFIDLNTMQNQTYSYRVSVVGKDTTESVKSDEVLVHIATFFSLDTIFSGNFFDREEIKGWDPNKFINKNGLFYMVSDSGVRVFDTLGNKIGIWGNIQDRPFEIAGDNSGRVYLSCVDTLKRIQSINVFNQNGTLAKRMNLKDTPDSIPSIGIRATLFTVSNNGNIIFVNSGKDSVYICDTAGSIIRNVGGFYNARRSGFVQEGITNIITDQNDKLYVYEYAQGIKVFDSEGGFIRTIQTGAHILYCNSISVDPGNGNIFYFVGGGYLSVCSPEGNPITGFSIANGPIQNVIVTGNKIYISTVQESYNDLTKTTSVSSSIIKLNYNLP
jgi:hypothetical protein